MPGRRIWVVFQPHTYSRTRALLPEFAAALASADRVVLAEIYASARERAGAGISSVDIAAQIPDAAARVQFLPSFPEIIAYLRERLQPGDVLMTMGAGDVYRVGYALAGREERAAR
jgi:UDP-N-acetylmuramate--alanine ligase